MVAEQAPQLESSGPRMTASWAKALGQLLSGGHVIGLRGDLGAGKTAFVCGLARGLEVAAADRVCSPTFTLINEHRGRVALAHIDLYRLSELDEMIEIGVLDYLGREDVVSAVEWIERLGPAVPEEQLLITFVVTGARRRALEITASGSRHRELAQRWLRQLGRLSDAPQP